jgi:predicted RNA polymerase sigma factor
MLGRLGRRADAARAYQAALDLAPAAPERDFIAHRIRELAG